MWFKENVMQKLLFLFMIAPIILCSQAGLLPEIFSEAQMVKVYNDGQEIVMSQQVKSDFDTLFVEALDDARQMPAFGVSIHKLTVEEMKSGIWVKFIYQQTMEADGMPFDELLVHVQKDMHGVNIIRGNGGSYNGRCFYLDLNGTLDEVYDFLANLENEEETVEVELEKGEEKEVTIVNEPSEENGREEGDKAENEIEGGGDDKAKSEDVLAQKVSQFEE